MLSAHSSLENFSFLYGTFPTASGVFSYAADYQIALNIIGTYVLHGYNNYTETYFYREIKREILPRDRSKELVC
jgi:hypothetical protein